MKKLIAIMLTLVLAASVAACGNQTSGSSASSTSGSLAASSSSEQTNTDSTSSSSELSGDEDEDTEISDEVAEIEKELLPLTEGDYEISDCMTLGHYKGFTAEYVKTTITKEDADEYLKNYYLTAEEVEDADAEVEMGDVVDIDYAGYIDGEEADGTSGNTSSLEIGSGYFIDGFEEGLIGMKVGEERDLDLTFPDDYWNSEMASQDITFHVTLNSISRYPEMDDDWADELTGGEYTTIKQLRTYIMELLQEDADAESLNTVQMDLWNQAIDACEFYQIPADLFETAYDAYYEEYEYYASYYGLEFDDFISYYYGVNEAEFKIYAKLYAQNVVESQLVRDEIWDAEGLSVDDVNYAGYEQEIADLYGITVEEIYSYFGEEEIDDYCRTYCVIDAIMSYADITEVAADETVTE